MTSASTHLRQVREVVLAAVHVRASVFDAGFDRGTGCACVVVSVDDVVDGTATTKWKWKWKRRWYKKWYEGGIREQSSLQCCVHARIDMGHW